MGEERKERNLATWPLSKSVDKTGRHCRISEEVQKSIANESVAYPSIYLYDCNHQRRLPSQFNCFRQFEKISCFLKKNTLLLLSKERREKRSLFHPLCDRVSPYSKRPFYTCTKIKVDNRYCSNSTQHGQITKTNSIV